MACKVSSLSGLRETSKLILEYRSGLSGTTGTSSGFGTSGHHSDTSGIGSSGDITMTEYGSDTTSTGSGLGIPGHHSGISKTSCLKKMSGLKTSYLKKTSGLGFLTVMKTSGMGFLTATMNANRICTVNRSRVTRCLFSRLPTISILCFLPTW